MLPFYKQRSSDIPGSSPCVTYSIGYMPNLPENVAVINLVYFSVSRICYTWVQRLCGQEEDVGQQPWVTRVCKLTSTCTSVACRTGNSVVLWKRELSPYKTLFSRRNLLRSACHCATEWRALYLEALPGFYLILLGRITLWCTSLILTNFLYKSIFYNRTEIKQRVTEHTNTRKETWWQVTSKQKELQNLGLGRPLLHGHLSSVPFVSSSPSLLTLIFLSQTFYLTILSPFLLPSPTH